METRNLLSNQDVTLEREKLFYLCNAYLLQENQKLRDINRKLEENYQNEFKLNEELTKKYQELITSVVNKETIKDMYDQIYLLTLRKKDAESKLDKALKHISALQQELAKEKENKKERELNSINDNNELPREDSGDNGINDFLNFEAFPENLSFSQNVATHFGAQAFIRNLQNQNQSISMDTPDINGAQMQLRG